MVTLYDHVRLHSRQKGSRLLVLLFIASHLDDGEQPSQKQLAEDSRMSVRQVTRIVDSLELSGELKVDRSGGHTAHRYAIPVSGSDNVANLSTLSKRQHGRLTAQTRADAVVQTDPINDDNLSTLSDPSTSPSCHDKVSTLSPNVDKTATSNDDNLSGTLIAPLEAETTSKKKPEANASRASAGVQPRQAYIGRLLKFREDIEGGRLATHGIEAGAAKWLFDQGFTEDEARGCYRYLVEQNFRGEVVTLKTVMRNIGAWKRGELSDGKRTQPQANGKPSRSEVTRNRDYSKRWGSAGGGGGDAGADSGPLPDIKRLAAPVRR